MEKTGESWQTAVRRVRAEGAPDSDGGENRDASGRIGEDGGLRFRSFRAQGLNLDATDFDGTQLLDILRGRLDPRKQKVLDALRLFRYLIAQRTPVGGLPLGGTMLPVPISPDQVNAHGRITIAAEVVVAPDEFDKIGHKPVALQLDRFELTVELRWYGPDAYYTISRVEIGVGRDFANGGQNNAETRDLALAADLCGLAVDILLTSARPSHSSAKLRPVDRPLDKRQQEILDVVGNFQFANGERTPATEVELSFPPEDAKTTEAAVEALVNNYLDRDANTLSLTPAGLLAYTHARRAAALVERLMDYLRYRAGQQRARFTHFTWDDLTAANVAGANEYPFVRAIVAILRIEGRSAPWDEHGGVWMRPKDIGALRAIPDIDGLRDRAERIRTEEAARAEAARQAIFADQEAAKQARWDETWHRLREWTNGSAQSERLAAQILLSEGYRDLDPSHPLGGPDGGQDAACTKDGEPWIMAVYFPGGQQKFAAIKKKFEGDLRGVANNGAIGLAFVTNQALTNDEKRLLRQAAASTAVELYHLERITAILDKPGMAAVRRQFLLIE